MSAGTTWAATAGVGARVTHSLPEGKSLRPLASSLAAVPRRPPPRTRWWNRVGYRSRQEPKPTRFATRTFWHVARTYALDEPDEQFVQFQVDVVAQDRPIVESQRPEQIPADITAELHVTDDKVSLMWRRLLTELAGRAAS